MNIARWSVTEVCDFIKKLPGCSDYVEDFMVQEIDGQALMLLQADHLMSAMSIKLGPALKICEQVDNNLQTCDFLSYIFSVSENTKIIHLIMMIWLFSFIISSYKLASSPPKDPGGSKKILSKSRI